MKRKRAGWVVGGGDGGDITKMSTIKSLWHGVEWGVEGVGDKERSGKV